MYREHTFAVPALLACLCLLVFCSSENGSGEGTDIVLDRTMIALEVGETVQVNATVVPEDEHAVLLWSSADEKVATVSDGRVHGIGKGLTTIAASCRKASRKIVAAVTDDKGKDDGKADEDDPRWQPKGCILFDCRFSRGEKDDAVNRNNIASYSPDGLMVRADGSLVRLDKFYALAQRSVRYQIVPKDGTVAVFQSNSGDFVVTLDVPNKRMSVATSPETVRKVGFLEGGKDFIVEIGHDYQTSTVKVDDPSTGDSVEIILTNDGSGGVGRGALQAGFSVGMQYDYYCFGLKEGDSYVVKRMTVSTPRDKVKLMIYGDSITQPEGYFPTGDFPGAWTQRIISRLGGDAVSSGRGGGVIGWVQDYIRNELPYIKAEYVMVTIGTNGGNTEENLSDLVKYIQSMGAIPILNNIPSNESGTQIGVNETIAKVREKLEIKGVKFDLATSIDGDGKVVDKSMMFWEDYAPESVFHGWQVYHHPNGKGGKAMFERALADVPEVFGPRELCVPK